MDMMLEDASSLLTANISKLAAKINGENDANDGTKLTAGEDEVHFSPEEFQLHELREARIRAAQMEKTMRWWSDCTANWRDKWGMVKNERNKARDEVKTLKQRLDTANEEIYKLKRERNEFREGNTKLRKDVEKMEAELRRDRRAFVSPLRVADCAFTGGSQAWGDNNVASSVAAKPEDNLERDQIPRNEFLKEIETPGTDRKQLEKDLRGHEDEIKTKEPLLQAAMTTNTGNVILNYAQDNSKDELHLVISDLRHQLTSLKEKLQNAEKEALEEKRSKDSLSETIDELKAEIDHLKGTIQEATIAKEKAVNDFNRLKEEKQRRLSESSDLYSKENVDRKLKELRVEIERLQKDNASEWSRREKLETEKLNAERENKKLKHQTMDLENELRTKINEKSQAVSFDLKQVQIELEDKKKELTDLKVSHTKLKRIYQDKKEDVLHTKTRVDHHEDEIKKLRARIDELKQKLTSTEDEVDQKDNLVRKLQRSLDEQTQQCHMLRVQMEHLQSRWKQMTSMARGARRGDKNSSSEEDSLLDLDDF